MISVRALTTTTMHFSLNKANGLKDVKIFSAKGATTFMSGPGDLSNKAPINPPS